MKIKIVKLHRSKSTQRYTNCSIWHEGNNKLTHYFKGWYVVSKMAILSHFANHLRHSDLPISPQVTHFASRGNNNSTRKVDISRIATPPSENCSNLRFFNHIRSLEAYDPQKWTVTQYKLPTSPRQWIIWIYIHDN